MRRFRYLLIGLFALAAVFSLAQGIINSQTYSQDLQWSGAKLLASGANPFEVYLAGNLLGEIIMSQVPNYLHLLYVFLLPLGLLDFQAAKLIWLLLNITCAALVLFTLKKYTYIGNQELRWVAVLFVISTPFRNTIGNGQISLLILLGFCVAVLSGNRFVQGVGGAISICKYSFAPPLALDLLFKKKYLAIILIAILHLLAILAFTIKFDANFITTAFLPINVSSQAVGLGTADVMSLSQLLAGESGPLSYIVSLTLCLGIYLAYSATTVRNSLADLSFISILSLACFKHLGYDFVFLLPVLVWAVKHSWQKNIVLVLVVFWFWYGLKISDIIAPINNAEGYYISFNFALLCVAMLFIWKKNKKVAFEPSK